LFVIGAFIAFVENMIFLRDCLSFGFEQTFTLPRWWTDPGFCATSDTPLKQAKMRELASNIAHALSGAYCESLDIYHHKQFETFDHEGKPSFVVTMDPGSIEVKTPPCLFRDLTRTMEPLFEAGEQSGLVPYREWWYGVQKGTEGGCHVNMAGLSPESNPWVLTPDLVLKYTAFYHNHPEIHYPFMGVDVGPGGNSMRMDEHGEEGALSQKQFQDLRNRHKRGESLDSEKIAQHFKGTRVAEDRHSAPSLCKYKAPYFMLEDRAVESLRSTEDVVLICDLRLKVFERLQRENDIAPLIEFGPELQKENLGCVYLWEQFSDTSRELGLNPESYRQFFERQFPVLKGGAFVPKHIQVREGRRPRVITGVQKRGNLEISKTVDTTFGRLEVEWSEKKGQRFFLTVNESRVEPRRLPQGASKLQCSVILDYHRIEEDAELRIALWDEFGLKLNEKCRFDLKSMCFAEPRVHSAAPGKVQMGTRGYADLGEVPSWHR